jgi:hypothetical protein
MLRTLAPLALLSLLIAPAAAQCNVAPPATCTIIGPGQAPPTASAPSTLSWPVGGQLCLSIVPTEPGFVVIVYSVSGATPTPLSPPVLCAPGTLYPVLEFANLAPALPPFPGSFCFAIPESLRGSGITVWLQGGTIGLAFCGRATDGYRVAL